MIAFPHEALIGLASTAWRSDLLRPFFTPTTYPAGLQLE
jgi:hypothetical protein